jgi:hypothetical protein
LQLRFEINQELIRVSVLVLLEEKTVLND